MLCCRSELLLSNESDGIIELKKNKYANKIGEKYFKNTSEKVIDLSITPNRPDCLEIRGIARDLSAAGAGKLKINKKSNLKYRGKQNINVTIKKKSSRMHNIWKLFNKRCKKYEGPKWLKDKILSLGQKPISAIVDITNYVMFDLNRPLHAYGQIK